MLCWISIGNTKWKTISWAGRPLGHLTSSFGCSGRVTHAKFTPLSSSLSLIRVNPQCMYPWWCIQDACNQDACIHDEYHVIMSSCHQIITFGNFWHLFGIFWQISCYHVAMSSSHPVSSYHLVIFSSCHLDIFSSWSLFILSSCHPVLFSSARRC